MNNNPMEAGVSPPPFARILVVGGGMMGASILQAARLRWQDSVTLYVMDHDQEVRSYCQQQPWVNEAWEIPKPAKCVDLVLLAVPIGCYETCLTSLQDLLGKEGIVLSDIGSSKRSVAQMFAESTPKGCIAIPGHPVAGIEKTGPWSARDNLFVDRYCVLTPDDSTSKSPSGKQALQQLTHFWQALGMQVEKMTPEHHDLVLSITSHLPTLIAYCLTGTAKDMEHLDWEQQFFADGRPVRDHWGNVNTLEIMQYAAGGFRDFTRIAASDPVMWRDVYLHNKSPVVYTLDLFLEKLNQLREAVLRGDGRYLEQCFERSQKIRQGIVEMRQAGQFEATEKIPPPMKSDEIR